MTVQFILGRSGTGKTSYCIKAIIDALIAAEDNTLILLVPEQATYQAERAILNDKRIAGYSGNKLRVLSFKLLSELLSPKKTLIQDFKDIGRPMIIQKILRDNKNRLKVFGSSANWPGLGRQMAQTIAELHQYAKKADDIDELLEKLKKDNQNNLTALKFADIGLVFKEYRKFIEGKFVDPDVQLNLACDAATEAGFAKGAKLWVDGFASFTGSEAAVLAELMKVAAHTQIALCLDPSYIDLKDRNTRQLDSTGLFNPTERTYNTIVEMVKSCKLKLTEPVILEKTVRFFGCQALAHIEHNVFESKPVKMKAADSIRVISAPNVRSEIQFVARQILKLVRENGYRYRNIAVIVSDIEAYEHYIKAYFDDYCLPFFIDKQKGVSQHPVVQLVCSALRIVTGGCTHSDVFAYLKTDMVPIERSDIDLLENYCLGFGVNGSDWVNGQEWGFAGEDNEDFDEQCINQIRKRVLEPLLKLRDKLCPVEEQARKIDSREFTRIIFDFLDSLGVSQRIAKWVQEAADAGDYEMVNQQRQFYDGFIGVFNQLVEVFAGQKMICQDYFAIINSAFSQLMLAFIPPSLDQVLVGSIERSRHPDLKAVFLVGATQKQFPVPVRFESILTDNDRIAAESVGFLLAATASQRLIERQYLAYIAFTRPSAFLCVSYPLTDDKGREVPRSQFIADLEALFENLEEESIAGEQSTIDRIYTRSELTDIFCSRLGKDAFVPEIGGGGRLNKLLDEICADAELGEIGSTIRSAINYDNCARLTKNQVEEFFGQKINCSTTKLGSFAGCPYQYFARYMLELKERKESKLKPLDIGIFYHQVLDSLIRQLRMQRKDIATVSEQELLEILKEQVSNVVQTSSFISNFVRHSAHNSFIIHSASDALKDCVCAVAQMSRAGEFRQIMSESLFGESENELGEYRIDLLDNRVLCLRGKIDRLDVAQVEGEKIAVIFDYKRSERSFSWSQFYYGLDMQLPIYMLAVRHAEKLHVKKIAGAFFIPVELRPKKDVVAKRKARGLFNGEFSRQIDSLIDSGQSKFYNFYIKSDGEFGHKDTTDVLLPDEFEGVLEFTEKKTVELAEKIFSGRIDIRPYRLNQESPCSRCEYKPLCRFDWQINEYNSLPAVGKNEVLKKIRIDG